MELFAPEFALEEINKYKKHIMNKNNLNNEEFEHIKFNLAIAIKFIPIDEYSKTLKYALKISPDPIDIDFFALAIKLKLPIWSNDAELKKQNKVEVITTTELMNDTEIKNMIGEQQ